MFRFVLCGIDASSEQGSLPTVYFILRLCHQLKLLLVFVDISVQRKKFFSHWNYRTLCQAGGPAGGLVGSWASGHSGLVGWWAGGLVGRWAGGLVGWWAGRLVGWWAGVEELTFQWCRREQRCISCRWRTLMPLRPSLSCPPASTCTSAPSPVMELGMGMRFNQPYPVAGTNTKINVTIITHAHAIHIACYNVHVYRHYKGYSLTSLSLYHVRLSAVRTNQ